MDRSNLGPLENLPKGMKIPDDYSPVKSPDLQEVQAISLKDENYAGDILKALENLPYNIGIEHLELMEEKGDIPKISLMLTIDRKEG